MKVIIKEREYQYTSDYPEGWFFAAGDYFKFPVVIGQKHKCFIKRFEKKTPDDISGWILMNRLKGKNEQFIARLYDIVKTEEKRRDVYYVFYELIEGATLDNLIVRNEKPELHQLTEDLFCAIASLNKYEHWFTDFCEKNIFCNEVGRFLLVDLDSAHSLTIAPNNEQFGNKEYLILVKEFYEQFLPAFQIKPSRINGNTSDFLISGITLNYLQIIFIIFRLKLYYQAKEAFDTNFDLLPSLLNDIDPAFKEVFEEVHQTNQPVISPSSIEKIKKLVFNKILNDADRKDKKEPIVDGSDAPIIISFATSAQKVNKGESFELSWDVKNAERLELYKNRALYKTLTEKKSPITLSGFMDGSKKSIIFELIAFNGTNQVKSERIIISLKTRSTIPPWYIERGIVVLIVLVLIVGFFVFWLSRPNTQVKEIKDKDSVAEIKAVPPADSGDDSPRTYDTIKHDSDASGGNHNQENFNAKILSQNHDTFLKHHNDFLKHHNDFLGIYNSFLGLHDKFSGLIASLKSDSDHERRKNYFEAIQNRYLKIKKDAPNFYNDSLNLYNDFHNMPNLFNENQGDLSMFHSDLKELRNDFRKISDVYLKYKQDSIKNKNAVQKFLKDSTDKSDKALKDSICQSISVDIDSSNGKNGLSKTFLGKPKRAWIVKSALSYLIDSVTVEMHYINSKGESKIIWPVNLKSSKNFKESTNVIKYDKEECIPKVKNKIIYLKTKKALHCD